jgi:putative transposase
VAAQQVIEAFPWDEVPRYLLRDRDHIYGTAFRQRVQHMGIEEVVIAPGSPWQNPYVERLIGSIRRECLDHVIVLHERHLRRLLTSYFQYYHHWRTHRALDMDCPVPRPVQRPEVGSISEVPEVGGWHHHYERRDDTGAHRPIDGYDGFSGRTGFFIKHKRELTSLPVLRYSSGHRKGRLKILYLP